MTLSNESEGEFFDRTEVSAGRYEIEIFRLEDETYMGLHVDNSDDEMEFVAIRLNKSDVQKLISTLQRHSERLG